MNRLLLGTIGIFAFGIAVPASAADLAARPYSKAAPMAAAAYYDWSGFYIGANGGYGTSRKEWDRSAGGVFSAEEGSHDATGAVAGGQIGYRWQSSAFVFGLEAQGDWADLSGRNASTVFALTNRSKINAFGLFTGQVGYSWNSALLYVKGGAAVVSDKYVGRVTATNVAFDRAKETRWGASVGTGFEYGFTPNWSAAIEYDHLFLGDRNNTFTSVVVPGAISRFDKIQQDADLITVRLNYKFGGPVVARY